MKKMQRFGSANDSLPAIPNDFPSLNQQRLNFEQNEYNKEFSRDYSGKVENGYERQNFENQFDQNSLPQKHKNLEFGNKNYEPVEAKITKEQQEYADNLFRDILKKPDNDVNKKKIYAEELKRQIQEKNSRKVSEHVEIGLDIGNNRLKNDKKQYAAELEAQIINKKNIQAEEKYSGFPNSIQGISEKEKKMKYAKELEAQIRQKKQEKPFREMEEEYFPFPASQDVSKEKKKIYAQELDAQIRENMKRNSNPYEKNPSNYPYDKNPPNYAYDKPPNYAYDKPPNYANDKPPNYAYDKNPPNYAYDKPPNYAYDKPPSYAYDKNPQNYPNDKLQGKYPYENIKQEGLSDHSLIKNEFFSLKNDYPPPRNQEIDRGREVPFRAEMNYPFTENEVNPPYSAKPIIEEPLIQPPPSNFNEEKKLRYRQELERQIEEQKRRKEEEKRKHQLDSEKAERQYLQESGIDPTKPIIRQRTVDPNRPSEDNPQAERYKMHLQRVKSSNKDSSRNLSEESLLTSDKKNLHVQTSEPIQNRDQKNNLFVAQASPKVNNQDFYSDPRPVNNQDFNNFMNPRPVNNQDFNNFMNPRPINNQDFNNFNPGNPDFSTNQDPKFKPNPDYSNSHDPDKNRFNPVIERQEMKKPDSNNPLIETYLREIQETRMERDRAREQCLEMREMMLKEKERNLEQLLMLVRSPKSESRPVSYQEQRLPTNQETRPYQGFTPFNDIRSNIINSDYIHTPVIDNKGIIPQVSPDLYQK